MTTTVTVSALKGFSTEHAAHFRKAAALLATALNHPDFGSEVLAAPYRELLFRRRDGRRVTKTPQEVLAMILEGRERDTTKDSDIDLAIRRDDSLDRPTVGSAITGKLPFRTSGWFIDLAVSKKDTVNPARHMVHEWLHVAGFVHRRNNGRREDVPYLVGDIVKKLLTARSPVEGAIEDEEVTSALERSLDLVDGED